MSVIFEALEEQVRIAALNVQRELQRVESIHRFSMDIEIEGRTDGDIKIVFRIGADYESGVAGNNVAEVLKEVMRRKGWSEANQPIMLSHVTGEDA